MHAPVFIADALHVLAAQCAAFESLLLLTSALHKGVRWRHLLEVVRQFAGVRPSLVTPVLAGVAGSEVIAAGMLFVPGMRFAGAALAAAIWAAYLVLIVRAIARGRREADCGCSFGPTQRPLGTYQVTRNVALLGLAVLVAMDFHGGGSLVQASQVLAACALLALYGALDQVMALGPLRGGEVS